jgi:hypothetical protein
MPRLKKLGRAGAALVAAVSGLLLLTLIGCKSPANPTDTTSSIVVTNYCGAKIDVYLDGTSKLTIENGSNDTILNVAAGSHLLEAKTTDTGILVDSETLTITASTSTSVTIAGPASLRITNLYGEILGIYIDDLWVGDIGDQITQIMHKVTFGSHVFTGKTKAAGTVVATVTIDFTDAIEYTWTITK